MDIVYTKEEIANAQADLNFHPNASSFWDSSTGQEVLEIARAHKLDATNTNRERCALHAAAMREANE
jgi:hypothetical protein